MAGNRTTGRHLRVSEELCTRVLARPSCARRLIRMRTIVFGLALAFDRAHGQQIPPLVRKPRRSSRRSNEGKELLAEGLIRRGKVHVHARSRARAPLRCAQSSGHKSDAALIEMRGTCARAGIGHRGRRCTSPRQRESRRSRTCCIGPSARSRARNDAGESVLQWAALTRNETTHAAVAHDAGADPEYALSGNSGCTPQPTGRGKVKLVLPRVKDRAQQIAWPESQDLARARYARVVSARSTAQAAGGQFRHPLGRRSARQQGAAITLVVRGGSRFIPAHGRRTVLVALPGGHGAPAGAISERINRRRAAAH